MRKFNLIKTIPIFSTTSTSTSTSTINVITANIYTVYAL